MTKTDKYSFKAAPLNSFITRAHMSMWNVRTVACSCKPTENYLPNSTVLFNLLISLFWLGWTQMTVSVQSHFTPMEDPAWYLNEEWVEKLKGMWIMAPTIYRSEQLWALVCTITLDISVTVFQSWKGLILWHDLYKTQCNMSSVK